MERRLGAKANDLWPETETTNLWRIRPALAEISNEKIFESVVWGLLVSITQLSKLGSDMET